MPYIGGLQSNDFLWETTDLAIWSVVEIGISIIATAATTFRPLLSQTRQFTISPSTLRRKASQLAPIRIGSLRRRATITEMKEEHPFEKENLPDLYEESARKMREWLAFEHEHGVVFNMQWEKDPGCMEDIDPEPTSPRSFYKDSDSDLDSVHPSEIARAY
jgi:hypothetical protein